MDLSGTASVPELGLEARDLAHVFAPGRGLAPTSFTLESPGVAAVTGCNGSGKSTLLRIVAGLLRPSGGRCTLSAGGRAIAEGSRRRTVGFAASDLAFYDEFTVRENLEFAAEALGVASAAGAVGRALERVGLTPRRDDRASELSSGMKQRLRLAFAILGDPPLLLLDEPGTHLDDAGRDVVRRLLEEQRARGIALVATNDEREGMLADRRIELRSGGLGDPA